MPEVTKVDLLKTGGKLVPPGALPRVGPRPAPRAAPPPPDPKPPAETPAEEAKSELPQQCPHCGWFQNLSPVEPTLDHLASFRECVWKGRPFTAEWNLFDDAMTVRFRGLTADEESAVRAATTKEIIDGRFGSGTPLTHFAIIERQTDLRFGLAVEFLRVGDRAQSPAPPEDPYAEDLGGRFSSLVKAFPIDTAYRAVRVQYGQFLGILHTIEARALNMSFSPATASSGA